MAVNDSTNFGSDVRNYIAQKTLSIAMKTVRFYQFGDKAQLPEKHGTTFQYTRYDRLALPQSPLTEGTAPASRSMGITVVTAVAEQWGDRVTITDVAELTIAHSPLQKAITLLGVQSAETIDREVERVIFAGTNVFYANQALSRAAIGSAAYLTENDVKRIVANLRTNGAMGMEKPETPFDDPMLGDLYIGIVDPYSEMDLTSISNFVDAKKYQDAKTLWNGEVGTWGGVRFVRSNLLPTITSGAAIAATNGSAGSFAGGSGTKVNYTVTGVDVNTGYERVVYQIGTAAFTSANAGTLSFSITMPTNTGFTYNVYVGAEGAAPSSTALFLAASGQSAGAAVVVTASPATTNTAVPALLGSAGSKIHLAYFLGKEAYTVVNLQNLQSTLTPPGETDSDPLAQRRHAGWKVFFKAVINNNNFFARWEGESNHD